MRAFRAVAGLLPIVGLLLGCGSGGSNASNPISPSGSIDQAAMPTSPFGASWEFNGQTWRAIGTPPACPFPLTFITPINLARVTSVLYPGNIRSGDYRPHGGFRLDGPGETGAISVVAPMASTVYRAARYLVNGEVQHMFDFINACGILHRLDHLRDLSPRFQQIAASLPPAAEVDSRTTLVAPGQTVSAGETIATRVGFLSGNVFVDWGVYDLRTQNESSANPSWLAQHPGEFAAYAICWFDNLSPGDSARVRSLPPSGGQGASDYCF